MPLVDLSHPIRPGMPVWPGDPEVGFEIAASTATHGFNLLALHLGTQSGTHVDAPFHVDDSLPRLHELPLDRFVGRALVADVRGLPHRAPIRPESLSVALENALPGDVLLLCTGWSEHWGTERYAAHPWLSPDAAGAVVEAGIRTVGIDAPSIDGDDAGLPTHHVLANAHCVIAENLRNLEKLLAPVSRNGSTNQDKPGAPTTVEDDVRKRPLAPQWRVWLMPLALHGADGSPVRAIAQAE